jgi:hypothetical protein
LNGAQLPFVIEGVWASPTAPALDQVVLVEQDANGAIVKLSVVETKDLAREQVVRLSGAAEQHARRAADLAQVGVGALSARMGRTKLIAATLLLLAWFLLPIASAGMLGVSHSVTFWQLLSTDLEHFNAEGSLGLVSLLGLFAVAAPFAAAFVRHPRAHWLNAVPLAFIVAVVAKLAWSLRELFGQMSGSVFETASDLISVRYGALVLLGASGFLAVQAFRAAAKTASGASAPASVAWLRDRRVLAAVAAVALLGAGAFAAKRFSGPSTSLFADTIDAHFKASPERSCWALSRATTQFPVRVTSGFGRDTAEHPILQGLVKGGYITVTSNGRPGMFGASDFIVDLTPKGRESKVWDAKSGFCVGQRKLYEIVSFSETGAGGPLQMTQVVYTWKLADTPDWVDADDFSAVEGMSKPVESMAVLRKTSSGWQML